MTITRVRHPLHNRSLRVLGGMRRHGMVELLLELPDDSKSFGRVEDWRGDANPRSVSSPRPSNRACVLPHTTHRHPSPAVFDPARVAVGYSVCDLGVGVGQLALFIPGR